MNYYTAIENLSTGMITDDEITAVVAEVEPLCIGDTSELGDWIREGAMLDGIDGTETAQDIADEWNKYTAQAMGNG